MRRKPILSGFRSAAEIGPRLDERLEEFIERTGDAEAQQFSADQDLAERLAHYGVSPGSLIPEQDIVDEWEDY